MDQTELLKFNYQITWILSGRNIKFIVCMISNKRRRLQLVGTRCHATTYVAQIAGKVYKYYVIKVTKQQILYQGLPC